MYAFPPRTPCFGSGLHDTGPQWLAQGYINADGGKIGSLLTLGVNCSIGKGGRGALLEQSRDAASKRREEERGRKAGREGMGE